MEIKNHRNYPLNCYSWRVLELREAETGEGFGCAGEKLLHQPFFMGLERVEFLAVRGNQLVERSQALGDFLLFGFVRTPRVGGEELTD